MVALDPLREDVHRSLMRYCALAVPSYSLRGGTREILRGMIAKGLDLR